MGWRHITILASGHWDNVTVIAAVCYLILCWNLILTYWAAATHRPPTAATNARLDALSVTVIIPVYNEDPDYLLYTLVSLSEQTRRPQDIVVIDDGSTQTDCRTAFEYWQRNICPTGIHAIFIQQDNRGKREAQARGVRRSPQADIFVTVDSDVRLDGRALELGLRPFARKKTMSVAGMLLGDNHRTNLLTRLIELGFVSSFLSGRAADSRLGSVTVNAGGFALYRAEVLRDRLDHYLTQRVLGRKVSSGDDAMLTRYALIKGHTRFAREAFGYTLHPTGIRHLSKQRTRWARSFWWGNVWMLRNFPVHRYAWWKILLDVLAAVWMAIVVPMVLIVAPARAHTAPWGVLAVLTLLSYLRNIVFLSLRRQDESRASQWVTYALSPLNALLNLYLGWVLTYVGLLTVAKTGWGTRSVVEVGADTVS